jgi:hypothetical protein
MPTVLETIASAIAHVPPRNGPAISGAPHEAPLGSSLVILITLAAVAAMLLMATLSAI